MDKYKRASKNRKIYTVIIIILDIIFMPWIAQLPFYFIKYQINAPEYWFKLGPINSIKAIFEDIRFLYVFLVLQIFIFVALYAINYNPKYKRVNIIQDGVGGPAPAGQGQYGTARWQTKKEKDEVNKVWFTDKGFIDSAGIIFGMEIVNGREKIWFNDDDIHTLIIGATRSGKSRKIILPSIAFLARAGESMVLGDPKGELYLSTKPYLESLGYNVIALNIREPNKGNRWNVLNNINKYLKEDNIPAAVEAAWDIADSIAYRDTAFSSDPIWENGEKSVIAALILLATMESDFDAQKHISTAYYLLTEMGQPIPETGIVPLVEYINSLPAKHPAKAVFATAGVAPLKTRASFFTQALSDMRLFSDPNIADMTSAQDHNFEEIGINKTAVFLIIPDEKSTRNVLATLYINQLYQSLIELANKRGGRIPRRVNFILDEFGNLPRIPDFDKKITVGGGRGIRFTLAVQGLDQVKSVYKERANTITGNCQNWLYLSTADLETAKVLSEKAGKYTVETSNISSTVQSRGHSSSHGSSLVGRPLLIEDEILRWPDNEVLVLQKSKFPARFPCPDLSSYSFNLDFGFVKRSRDIKADKEMNRRIIEERLNSLKQRQVMEPLLWFPNLSSLDKKNFDNNSEGREAEFDLCSQDINDSNNSEVTDFLG